MQEADQPYDGSPRLLGQQVLDLARIRLGGRRAYAQNIVEEDAHDFPLAQDASHQVGAQARQVKPLRLVAADEAVCIQGAQLVRRRRSTDAQ
jgi:hypothetical protein